MKLFIRFFLVILSVATLSCSKELPSSDFWQDGICRQENFMPVESNTKKVTVRTIESGLTEFEVVDLPESFINWNKESRLGYIEDIRGIMRGEGSGPRLSGPHNGMVATSGYKREDACFSLNNAVKGMGFIPKPEKMEEMIAILDSTENLPMPAKLGILEGFYEHLEENFDLDKQGSLELYSQPKYMTQSFLNQMYNPVSTVVFLDIPSYKLKTAVRLLDPKDTELTDYEKQVVTWINKIHNYFHGPFEIDFIGVIYYVVEVYDNSPMGSDPGTGMGRKIMPLLP